MTIKISKGARAYTKSEAYHYVMRLFEGEKPEPGDLEGLVLYFAPKQPGKPKDNLDWLAMACDTSNKYRDIVRYVHVRDGKGYATNGARAHCAPVDMEDGCYCPRTHMPVTGVVNGWNIIDRNLAIPDDAMACDPGDLMYGLRAGYKEAELQVRFPGTLAWNGRYYEQATSIGEPDALYVSKEGAMLHGVIGDRVFVIMGLRG